MPLFPPSIESYLLMSRQDQKLMSFSFGNKLAQHCFFSRLAYFSGKADESLTWVSLQLFTSKNFYQKNPTGTKVIAVSKQVVPSTSCLPGSRGFSRNCSCFQGFLNGPYAKAVRSEKGKAISEDKIQA